MMIRFSPYSKVLYGREASLKHSWSTSVVDADKHREFTLKEVKALDVDAVRTCDGFEYRYHQGGLLTWFSLRTEEELAVLNEVGLPHASWRHLPTCTCSE